MQAINDNQAKSYQPATFAAAADFRFLAIPKADHVALYWPLHSDAPARDLFREVRAVPVGLDSQPASALTRRIFGNTRVGHACVTFAAYARIVAAGHAVPTHRA